MVEQIKLPKIDPEGKQERIQGYSSVFSDLQPLGAAAIAVKLVFDKYSTKDDTGPKVTKASVQLLNTSVKCSTMSAVPVLKIIKDNYWHRACGTQQKLVVVRTLINRTDVVPWEAWKPAVKVKLGFWLFSCVVEASGWFSVDTRREGRKTVNYVIPTPEFLKIKDSVMAQCELFSPIAYPCSLSLMTGTMTDVADTC